MFCTFQMVVMAFVLAQGGAVTTGTAPLGQAPEMSGSPLPHTDTAETQCLVKKAHLWVTVCRGGREGDLWWGFSQNVPSRAWRNSSTVFVPLPARWSFGIQFLRSPESCGPAFQRNQCQVDCVLVLEPFLSHLKTTPMNNSRNWGRANETPNKNATRKKKQILV